jgi:hypothetical protein
MKLLSPHQHLMAQGYGSTNWTSWCSIACRELWGRSCWVLMTHNDHEDHMKLVVEYASQSHWHMRFYRQPEFQSWSVESALESEVREWVSHGVCWWPGLYPGVVHIRYSVVQRSYRFKGGDSIGEYGSPDISRCGLLSRPMISRDLSRGQGYCSSLEPFAAWRSFRSWACWW